MKYNADNELRKLDKYYPNSDLKYHYGKHRDEIISLLGTIETVWKTKQLDKKNYDTLYKGLKNSWEVVFYYAVGEQINLMIGKIVGIENLIFDGITDKSWQTRFNTVVIMKAIDNKELKSKVVELGLNDKSKRVREMAANVRDYYLS